MTTTKPVVRVIGTGGSIAGVGPDRLDYMLYSELGEHLTIQQSLDRVPEINGVAHVRSEDMLSVGSTAIGPPEWLQLGQRVNQIFEEEGDVTGVAITHGTATLEETAYFLHLTVKSSKPVVVTGAMRPPTAISTDADLNLLDAVRIASLPEAGGRGVLTVLNNEIQCARDVTKANTYRVETFRPNELGFLGYADSDGEVVFYRNPTRKHTIATPFDVSELGSLPRVDIVYSYAGSDGLLVDAVRRNRSDGLVLAGFGGGTFPPAVQEAGAAAVRDGIPVVMATRATAGRVVMTPQKEDLGFIVCDNLLPQKARILLMMALTVTQDRKEIQRMFYEF
jgi:L-asparaginase